MTKIACVLIGIIILFFTGCTSEHQEEYSNTTHEPRRGELRLPEANNQTTAPATTPKLSIRHLPGEVFERSITHPRQYNIDGLIKAGVVPHHDVAASLISGFFAQAAINADHYDTVIIIGPNHSGEFGDIVLSYKDWAVGDGVIAHGGFVESLMNEPRINAVIHHEHMQAEWSASILIPYIHHFLPGAKVAPVLVSRALSFGQTAHLFHWLNNWINTSGENILLVASIDFSHYLTAHEARERDIFTTEAILAGRLQQIHTLDPHYLDSPAALIVFLMYLDALGIAPQIIDRTDASEFLGTAIPETTSYKIIVGTLPYESDSMSGLPPEPNPTVTLTFAGDIMLHEPQTRVCFDHSLRLVSPILQSADIAIGNLETVFGGFFSDFPLFSAPDAFGHALKNAGFDLLSTANNHSLDQGVDGLVRNLDFLESIGIGTFGTYRNQSERDSTLVVEAGGIRFAFLAYTFGTNNQPIPPGRDYLVNLLDINLIRRDVARARELADFVIIMPHMGFEYETFVRPEIKEAAMLMLEAGADIIVAGHPHVLQPMGFAEVHDPITGESRRGFVAYCLGNFISSQTYPGTDTGVLLNLYFSIESGKPTLTGKSTIPIRTRHVNLSGQPDVFVVVC